jgi:hypothetical protein
VKARSPAALRIATRWWDASNAWNACCNSTATPLEIAFRFSGRLMRMIETGPRSSVVTTLIRVFPLSIVVGNAPVRYWPEIAASLRSSQ